MEKQYVFFETGAGLATLGCGLLILFAGALALAAWSPLGRFAASVAVVGSAILVVWLSFKIDRWRVRNRPSRGANVI